MKQLACFMFKVVRKSPAVIILGFDIYFGACLTVFFEGGFLMIFFYSGTPGSGKSLHVAKDIVQKLTIRKQNVITNMTIDYDYIRTSKFKKFLSRFFPKINPYKKNVGKYYYIDNQKLTPEFLFQYAKKFHVKGKEGQTLLVLDECQMMFSPTVVKLKCQEDKLYRQKWLDFFTQHRHLGYNIILISQFDRLVDPQIRCLFEYNCIHRKVNNFKIGWVLSLFKLSLFCCVQYWYGVNQKTGVSFYLFSKKYAKVYDSYKKFDDLNKKKNSKKIA